MSTSLYYVTRQKNNFLVQLSLEYQFSSLEIYQSPATSEVKTHFYSICFLSTLLNTTEHNIKQIITILHALGGLLAQ
jgi:hypothetical protein